MFKYKLRWTDGSDAGEHECSTVIHPREIVWVGGGQRLCVVELLPCEAASPYTAVLVVEPA